MSYIELEERNKTAIIRFNREKSFNAMNGALIVEFAQKVRLIEQTDFRTIILTGRGPAFSAGGDVISMMETARSERGKFFNRLTFSLHEAILDIAKSGKIWIAAVNGVAAGAGVSVALACDMTVASEDAKFILSYEKIGLTPDGGTTFFLTHLLGFKKALEIVLKDPVIDVHEALRLNIISQYFKNDRLLDGALSIAESINEKSQDAMIASKRLIREPYLDSLKEQLNRESRSIAKLSETENAEIGMKAFIEKKFPRFK